MREIVLCSRISSATYNYKLFVTLITYMFLYRFSIDILWNYYKLKFELPHANLTLEGFDFFVYDPFGQIPLQVSKYWYIIYFQVLVRALGCRIKALRTHQIYILLVLIKFDIYITQADFIQKKIGYQDDIMDDEILNEIYQNVSYICHGTFRTYMDWYDGHIPRSWYYDYDIRYQTL